MKTRLAKSLSSLVLAAAISFTGMTTHAAEVSDNAYIGSTNICDTENWSIEDYADNIKDIYIMSYPEGADVIAEIVDGYLSDNEFVAAFGEMGGSAFLIVEEALHNVLEPSAAPILYESDTYFSRNSMPTIKQKSGYDDGAAAAVLMALYGCGHYNFYKDASLKDSQQSTLINEMTWNADKKTTIGEVTRTLRRYYSGTYGCTFQTKYTSDFNKMISILTNSLYMDAAPIIRIPAGNSYYYGVVSSIYESSEDDAESISIIDPRTGTYQSYTFDEFERLLFPSSQSIVWMSVYDRDNSTQAIEEMKSKYPSGNSYFTIDGGKYDGGEQCAGFARYVFHEVKGRMYTDSRSSNITGFGEQLRTIIDRDDYVFSGEPLTEETAKKYLLGISTGAYVRVEIINSKNPSYPWHSFAVLETSDNGIKFYEANVGGYDLIRITECTWAEFAQKYRLLFYVD